MGFIKFLLNIDLVVKEMCKFVKYLLIKSEVASPFLKGLVKEEVVNRHEVTYFLRSNSYRSTKHLNESIYIHSLRRLLWIRNSYGNWNVG